MNEHRIDGLRHRLKGAAKAGLGKIIGDAKLVTDGEAEHARGVAEAATDDAAASAIGADKDRLEGIGHQWKGTAKQGVGKLFGDAKLQAEGAVERLAGKAQNAIGSARDEARDALEAPADADGKQRP